MSDAELIRRGDVRKALLEYLEETGSELERWDIDQIVSGIADRIEVLATFEKGNGEWGMTVTRFEMYGYDCESEEAAEGDWVQYVDHAAALTAAADRIEALTAKLAKAVEALEWYDDPSSQGDLARATLAEIKGESQDGMG